MLSLKKENLEAFVYLQKSGFCGSLSGRAHTMIPINQMIEMTINRSSKETGGLSGKSENVGATERRGRIHHHMVAMRERLNKKIKKNTKHVNVELGKSRMERDERDVLMILSCVRNWVPNLWQPDQKITNIATRKIATEEMTKNALSVRKRGKEAMDMFIKRFTTSEDDINNEKLSYYDPIKKQPMKLFNETVIKTKHTIPEDEDQSFAEILEQTLVNM